MLLLENECSFRLKISADNVFSGGSSMRQKNQEKYKRIIDAATKVFAEKGFYKAKVSEIAQQAGVADGTIYIYFDHKDDILISLFEEKMKEVLDNMKEQISSDTKFFEYLDLIGDIIEEGKERGLIRDDILPGIAKRAFFGALDEMSRFWVLSKKPKYDIETASQQISSFFINGIRR
jgi:TetR/AcrR family fatty acid metabolism transcriptional regulator